MAIETRNTLKAWFVTAAKPLQAQFWAWLDSFWHKDELIPITAIEGLETIVGDISMTPIRGQHTGGAPTVITLTHDSFVNGIISFAGNAGNYIVSTQSDNYLGDYDDAHEVDFTATLPRFVRLDKYLFAGNSITISGSTLFNYIILIQKARA